MSAVDGDGVQLSNITVKNWKGTEAYGAERGPVKVICADGAPCYDITIEDFAMWTEEGDSQWYSCESAYGSGFCLQDSDDHVSYSATTSTVDSAPSGYSATSMAADLTTDFGSTVSIPIPTIPTSFYPGATPYSALMADSASTAAASSLASHATVSSSSVSVAASVPSAVAPSESIPAATSAVITSAAAVTPSPAVGVQEGSTTSAPSFAAPSGAGDSPQGPSGASGFGQKGQQGEQSGQGEQGEQGGQEVCYV